MTAEPYARATSALTFGRLVEQMCGGTPTKPTDEYSPATGSCEIEFGLGFPLRVLASVQEGETPIGQFTIWRQSSLEPRPTADGLRGDGSDAECGGEGNRPEISALWGWMGAGQAVASAEAGEATADGGGADAKPAGDSAECPAALVAESQEAAVGIGIHHERQIDIPLLYGRFLHFFD